VAHDRLDVLVARVDDLLDRGVGQQLPERHEVDVAIGSIRATRSADATWSTQSLGWYVSSPMNSLS
jgi:hypothetical protein